TSRPLSDLVDHDAVGDSIQVRRQEGGVLLTGCSLMEFQEGGLYEILSFVFPPAVAQSIDSAPQNALNPFQVVAR
ncbi:MAG: hypothetical protein AAGI67_20040, partial [Pseudomonadota bacterium]